MENIAPQSLRYFKDRCKIKKYDIKTVLDAPNRFPIAGYDNNQE